ncbi:MAG: S9 family peptidase [Gemmatimonadetes bacterium]|nr:S9 family peptidase [Gemmatimonadota bacterium]MYF72155.1 S9 family peptidase [Gemmatimonadota bacterium]MYK51355.1 S9 family peptidase [Gemmatimonadota bacterium]
MARISPDGEYLSYLAPVAGVLNVWVTAVEDPDSARPITKDEERGIRLYIWTYDGQHILYYQDAKGDEDWHVYATNITTGETRDLTPFEKVNAQILSVNEKTPNEILVGINNRNPQLHDVYRIALSTGERTLIEENPGFVSYLFDNDDRTRFAMTFSPTGGQEILQRDESNQWQPFIEVPNTDALTTYLTGFDKSNQILYLIDSRKRNTAALFTLDLVSRKQELVAEDDRADVGGILVHPTEKHVQAVSFIYDRNRWHVLDPAIQEDMDYLHSVEDGELSITSRTLDDRLWTAAYVLDNGPVKYYLYDRTRKQANYLFSNRTDLDEYQLARMHSLTIKSRDGWNLVRYLTLPPDSAPEGDARPSNPVPLVLLVHGGPWGRDIWGYNSEHQWLSNRGYAVLSVNFRGSTGFGKEFTNAGNGEWAGKMHDDLIDAVNWAIREKITQRDQVAIMGGSYGGYATLVGLTFTPETFVCGVDIVGPSNLVTLLQNVPPYWIPILPMMKDRVGDWTTEEGQQSLLAKSPLARVDQIQRPLLIGQGANDPRVKQVESDQIVEAMKQKNIPVTYVLYPDEGHGFARPENRLSFYAVAEAFLSEHLNGRFEPVGEDFQGAKIQVPEGADQVPGLQTALA